MSSKRIIRNALKVRGREVTVASPLILPPDVNNLTFRVRRPTTEDDRNQFADTSVDTLFQLWMSADEGRTWDRSWSFTDTGGKRIINDHPWQPRVYLRGMQCNDATTRYRALEDTDQPPTNPRYWQPIGPWIPKEAGYSLINIDVKADGLQYLVTATHEGDAQQLIEPELIYNIGPRAKYLFRNSVGFVDSEVGAASGTTITSPGLTVSGSNTLFAASVGTYGGSVSSIKLNNGAGADFTQVNHISNAYSDVDNRYIINPTNNDAVYLTGSGGSYRFLRIISVNNADQSTQPLSSGSWTTQGIWSGGSKTFSNNIPSAAGAMVFGTAMFVDNDYVALGNPTVGTGQNAVGATNHSGAQSLVASYETATGSTESTSFTLVESGPGSQSIYYSIAAWTIKEATAGGTSVTPATADITSSAANPTVVQGSITITPATADVTTSAIDPSIATSSVTITPETADITATGEDPVVVLGGITPETADISATAEDPSVVLGSVTVTPATADITTTGEDPIVAAEEPIGDIDFDCAVGHDALAIRRPGLGLIYDGDDTDSAGFKLQYRYRVNAGSYSSWTDITQAYILYDWPFQFNNGGSGFSAGDIVTVQLRAVNNSGPGIPSAEKAYKIHDTWHRSGARRWKPSSTVGHASSGYDVTPTTPMTGPVTTGGVDRFLLAFQDTAYGQPTATPNNFIHSFKYDDVLADELLRLQGAENRRNYGGGTQIFGMVNPPVGQHTGRYDWVIPTTERSTWQCVSAFQLVDQNAPVAAIRSRLEEHSSNTEVYPGINDESQFDSDYDNFDDGSAYASRHVKDVSASYDELILSCHGTYGQTNLGGGAVSSEFGEAGATGAAWGSHTSSPPQAVGHMPFDSNLDPYVGCGAGAEDFIRIAVYEDGNIPATMPLHYQRWHEAYNHGWTTLHGVALRPSPNMASAVSVLSATQSAISLRNTLLCNHGTVIHAIVGQSDPTPTAIQIQDEIASSGSSDYSGGTIHLVAERVITSGDSLAVTGGNLDSALSGLTAGDYKVASAYQQQQAFKGGTGTLGAVVTANFTIEAGVEVTPETADVTSSAVDPTVRLGSIAITPASADISTDAVDPSVQYGSVSVTPATADVAAQGVDPTVQLGSTSVVPETADTTAEAVDPNVIIGAIIPETADATSLAEDPSVVLGSINVTPESADITADAVSPTVVYGPLTIVPESADVLALGIDPSVVLGGIIPEAAEITVTAQDPIVDVDTGPIVVTPASADITASAASPIVEGGVYYRETSVDIWFTIPRSRIWRKK